MNKEVGSLTLLSANIHSVVMTCCKKKVFFTQLAPQKVTGRLEMSKVITQLPDP